MGATGLENRALRWSEIQDENIVIVKKGELLKQSKYLKDWRKRTVMLANGHIMTFNEDNIPTTVVSIFEITNLLKQQSNHSYFLKINMNNDSVVVFKTDDQYERDQWFSCIKSQKIRAMKDSYFSIGHTQGGEEGPTFLQYKEQRL